MTDVSRRKLLGTVGLAGAAMFGAVSERGHASEGSPRKHSGKVLVVGAHPDDPETGCGGTIARFSKEGHEVVILYLTRGEAGIPGKTLNEAAQLRTAECNEACRILGARPVFAGQIDAASQVTAAEYDRFKSIVQAEKPAHLFTHWPLDTHRDHRAASLLAYDAWLELGKSFDLYFYEVFSGIQTQGFSPTDYVDISSTEPRKRMAVFAHATQNPNEMYIRHDTMSRFRGIEMCCEHAEAFIRHGLGSNARSLLPLGNATSPPAAASKR